MAQPLAQTIARLDDRLNPVLVKELRQAVRGRLFVTGFLLALVAAVLLLAMGMADVGASPSPEDARRLAVAVALAMTGALVLYVPFHALQTTVQEGDEGTLDLLQLSDVGPWRTALGKLLASQVLALLLAAALAPFVVVVALLPGVHTAGLLGHVATAAGAGAILSALAVGGGAAARRRAFRVLVQLVLLGAVGLVFALLVQLSFGVVGSRASGVGPGIAMTLLWGPGAIGLLLSIAAVQYAHPMDDVSRGLRLSVVLFAVGAALAQGFAMPSTGASGDEILVACALTHLVLVLPFAHLGTEPRGLPRRCRAGVAGRGRLAVLGAPLVRGQDRAALLLLLVGLVVCGSAVAGAYVADRRLEPATDVLLCLTFVGTVAAFTVLPGAIVPRERGQERERRIVRLGIAGGFLFLSIGMPALGFLLLQSGDLFEMPLNPLYALVGGAVGRGRGGPFEVTDGAFGLWFALSIPSVLVAAYAAVRGVEEVRAARRGDPAPDRVHPSAEE